MARFSRKERLIATLLAKTPVIKGLVKKVYIALNYAIYRRNRRIPLLEQLKGGGTAEPTSQRGETFFGYYDKSPVNNEGVLLYCQTDFPTSRKPNADKPISIFILDPLKGKSVEIGRTASYNWQQGARAQWISDSEILYNIYDADRNRYRAVLYDCKKEMQTRIFDHAVQDAFKRDYFLSVNYRRIMKLRPDYGYRNNGIPSDAEMRKTSDDGIWKTDINSGETTLLLSLDHIIAFQAKNEFKEALHKVNHVMIAPDGSSFIFIHRWYLGKRRYDRLLLWKEGELRILADECMVSHLCWTGRNTIFGYLRYYGKDAFHFIDTESGHVELSPEPTALGFGDGHPTCRGSWIAFDTYPDKGRLQHLFLFNTETKEIHLLASPFSPLRYQGESRCDLHPRFSSDGCKVYFDTVDCGTRRLAWTDVSNYTVPHSCGDRTIEPKP